MRLSVVVISLYLAACSTTDTLSTLSNEPVDGCEVTDCFNRLQIRNVEVVNRTTLLLRVGNQQCPFRVSFDGPFCDLTFLPGYDVAFTTVRQRQINMRICSNDRHVGIDEGPFTSAVAGAELPGRLPCEILDVASLTDDELIELYVDNGITAPPPPFGTGQIQVPDPEPAEEGAASESGEAAEPDGQAADQQASQPTAAARSQ